MNQPGIHLDGKRGRLCRGLLAGALCLGLWWPGRGLALDPAKAIFQYNCQTWSRQNGLPVNGINAIAQTRDGYLWLGTAAGLVRFDGTEFKMVDLARVSQVRNTVVNSLTAARAGGLWVGLDHSAFGFYDGHTFSFRGKDTWGGVDLNVRAIVESQDASLCILAEGHLSRVTPAGLFEDIMSSSSNAYLNLLSSFEDSQGRLWVGGAGAGTPECAGVHYWQEGKIAKLSDPVLDEASILSLASDTNGQLWVGTSQGLYCFDAKLQRKEIPPLGEEVRALLVDRHGVLWIGTSGRGVGRLQNGALSFLGTADGLAGDYVKCLAEDREGSLWIGTRSGVSQLTDMKFSTERAAEDSAEKDAWCVCPSRQGGVWVGSSGGLTYLDGKAKTYSTEAGVSKGMVKRVFEAGNGDVYLVSGTSNLLVFSGGKVVAKYSATNMVVGLGEDEHGVVASVGNVLYRAGTNYFTPCLFTNGNPDLWWVLNLAAARDGGLWVACANGIFRIKNGGFQQYGSARDFPDTHVMGICEDSDGVVWGWLLTGIARLKDGHIRRVDRQHGLFDNNIYAIVPDDFGDLWVDSGRGIFRVSRKGMNDFADGKTDHVECAVYDGPEDVKSMDKTFQERVGCKSLDGRIYFPSPFGVVVIDPAHVPNNPFAPPVHITSLRANGIALDKNKKIIVPPGKGELEVHFAALSFVAPQKARFRYRLEGYDQDWVETKDRRLAYYTNLKPGRYDFTVLAANADGVWNQAGDGLEIELRPHYYQTGWFDLLCAALALSGLAGVVTWRVRHLQTKQEALQKARDHLEAEVRHRTAELATANSSLLREVQGHQHAEAELKQRTLSLESEIEERKKMQLEVERSHLELLEVSRQAGMTEIATNVLHNVGNILNSVNVSATLATRCVKKSRADNLAKVAAMLREHEHDLGAFITSDPKGKQVPSYLAKLSEHLLADQEAAVRELDSLRKNIEHINEIVAMQQNYATVSGVKELVNIPDLVEDSLRMNLGALSRHGVKVIRDYQKVPPMTVEKHKILQILINLLRNAKYACDESGRADKRLTVRVWNGQERLKISVIDNGVGIPPENLTRIFNHGFTTRRKGHGFGLHSGALAAREMGGSLSVHSEGPGKGAAFTLELPIAAQEERP